MSPLHSLSLIALTCLALGACRSRPTDPEPLSGCLPPESPPPPPQAAAPAESRDWETLARSVEGRPIEVARFGEGPSTVLMVATIHGDEAAGTPLLRELAHHLAAKPEWLAGRRVVIVPVLNPDGLENDRRHNARDVDLNRNFPAQNRRTRARHGEEALSEPEARALHELLLSERPELIISLHQAANCIDYDGPAQEVAERMARASDLPIERLGARPGSLGSFAGVDLGIPTLTVELPRSASSLDGPASWERYGAMLRAAIEAPGSPRSRNLPGARGCSGV